MTEKRFEGHADRVCGEHRTTGQRAWCFECSEWCYENVPCKGCELPALRALVLRLDWPNIHTHYGYATCADCDIYKQLAWPDNQPDIRTVLERQQDENEEGVAREVYGQ